MKIDKEYYLSNMRGIEDRYVQLAEELTDQLLYSMDWEGVQVDAQTLIALWLKYNEPHCTNE